MKETRTTEYLFAYALATVLDGVGESDLVKMNLCSTDRKFVQRVYEQAVVLCKVNNWEEPEGYQQ